MPPTTLSQPLLYKPLLSSQNGEWRVLDDPLSRPAQPQSSKEASASVPLEKDEVDFEYTNEQIIPLVEIFEMLDTGEL